MTRSYSVHPLEPANHHPLAKPPSNDTTPVDSNPGAYVLIRSRATVRSHCSDPARRECRLRHPRYKTRSPQVQNSLVSVSVRFLLDVSSDGKNLLRESRVCTKQPAGQRNCFASRTGVTKMFIA